MKKLLFATLATVLVGVSAHAQDDLNSDLEQIRVNRHMPGLSAVVVKQSHLMARGAAGYRKLGQPTPLLVTDPVNIASCTKWMTATTAGRLVDRGLISWNTRVRDVFPNYQSFSPSFWNATLEQILSHRAGIQQGTTFESTHWAALMAQNGTIPQIRRWVSNTVLTDAPETTPGNYLYSNQGYAVAATMLEIITGKDWETLVREEVLTPTNMTTATYGQVDDGASPPKAPVGHDLASGQTVPVPRAPMDAATHLRYQAAYGPGGYVACTLEDWAKFLTVHTASGAGTYLSAATETKLQQPYTGAGTEGYGLGIAAVNRSWATPGQALNHSGDIFGQDTVVWMAPVRDLIVVVFTNCRSADNSTALALDDVAALAVTRYSSATAAGPLLGGYGNAYSPPGFFRGETDLGNHVEYLDLAAGRSFGYYSFLADPHYLYHFDLGYEYVFDAADNKSGVYLYDFKSNGFFYTSPAFPFPYLYDFRLNTVLYYYPDPNNAGHYNTNGVRYFYNYGTGQIISK